ncbi:MAG TPA: glycogen/starch/alpha-glucan phosphorylase [Acetobacteraceae bacterium]|nr:glycogen/starch/alpha-glucan phosphorylase [Acetobacteraceae bacterium]
MDEAPRSPEAASEAAATFALPAQDEDVATLRRSVVAKLTYAVGKDPIAANDRDWFVATALTVRDRIVDRWMASTRKTYALGQKRVYYLSLEFLIGRLLHDSLSNLGITDQMRRALAELGVDLDRLRTIEPDAALGNGGLGRLAACFMESMATLGIPSYGYGIRYSHGLFHQVISDGWQREYPENWLNLGNPWEFERAEVDYQIGFGGQVEALRSAADGSTRHVWHPAETVVAIAYDTAVVGWRGKNVNTLRLWSARAPHPLQLEEFNRGDHVGALQTRVRANAISQILYPSDETPAGQELRLRQEYFFSSASLQDLVRRHVGQHGDIRMLPEKAAIQLNDTHPAVAIAELMRILVDLHDVPWAEAWEITRATFSYTNHTLLPEALESWPVPLMERLLPRHMQIIYMINWQHLDVLRKAGRDDQALSAMSLIDEQIGRRVRMGTLAFLASHKINGVSALHTELLRKTLFRDLNAVYPGRITNKTNGITQRRWLFSANPALTELIADVSGPQFLDDIGALERFAAAADDTSVHERLAAIRRQNKIALARIIAERLDVKVDPDAMFDVHIKRIHEYKRQLMNILHTVALYDAMRAQPMRDWVPRVKIFAGKAAASYHRAKLIIKLANDVARVVNTDPTLRGLLKVVFLPNYNVSLAETIIPAADLSEQISTAGMEASGTGNMKFALNGALTIGTLDGANVEIRERVGAENIVIFGLNAERAARRRREHEPRAAIAACPMLAEVLDAIGSGVFAHDQPSRFRELVEELHTTDKFLVTDDFDSYVAAQQEVGSRWQDRFRWWRTSIMNTAHTGWFSSDRAMREYAGEIWQVPVPADAG